MQTKQKTAATTEKCKISLNNRKQPSIEIYFAI